ncbi:hypothetical protein ACQ86B_17555 [Mycolicibacterium aichiense]|uniref:hypothetical protein n=1 Tax=Mycolicibacterium aichiense TaxID=1799 RepID=UPI003D66BFCE
MKSFFAALGGARQAANWEGNDKHALSTAEQRIVTDVGYHVNVQNRAPYKAVIRPITN